MKVLSGVIPHGSYQGDILYDGEPRSFADIADSEHVGIIIIHQELALVPLLSIAENIFLGNETANKIGVIDWGQAYAPDPGPAREGRPQGSAKYPHHATWASASSSWWKSPRLCPRE